MLSVLPPQWPRAAGTGGKRAQCTERAFLIEDRKSGARKANTRAVLLLKEAIVVTLSPRQYRTGKAMRDKEAPW